MTRGRAWDLPTRAFHWTLALLAVASFTTGKLGGAWLEWHMRSGYAILALLVFRLAWGLVGPRNVRFSAFLRGPRAVLAYARALAARDPPEQPGHNPLGGWMVVLMLLVLLAQAATGLFTNDEGGSEGPLVDLVSNAMVDRMSVIHGYNQWAVAAVVALHVAAIAFYRWVLRRDLVGPMIHGGAPAQRPAGRGHALLAAILLAASSGAVYYLVVMYPRAPA